MTSAIDIKRYRTRAQWRDMARATAHVRSFWKFFHFVNQFPRPARKNGHPVLSSRFLSRVFVITISSHLNWINIGNYMIGNYNQFQTFWDRCYKTALNFNKRQSPAPCSMLCPISRQVRCVLVEATLIGVGRGGGEWYCV
jgi:hypothetical protein